jgi:hypothetical protein
MRIPESDHFVNGLTSIDWIGMRGAHRERLKGAGDYIFRGVKAPGVKLFLNEAFRAGIELDDHPFLL